MKTKTKWRRNSDEGSYLTDQHGMVIQGVGKRVRLSKSAPWNWEVDYKGERIRGTADTCRDAKSAVESYLEPKETIVKTKKPRSIKTGTVARDRISLAIAAEFKHFVNEMQKAYDDNPALGHEFNGLQTALIDLDWCKKKAWAILSAQFPDHADLETSRIERFVERAAKHGLERFQWWCRECNAKPQAVSHYWLARRDQLAKLHAWIGKCIAAPCDKGFFNNRNSFVSALVNTVDTHAEKAIASKLTNQADRELWLLDMLLVHDAG